MLSLKTMNKNLMFPLYILTNIFVGLAAPMFFAVVLPLSTLATFLIAGSGTSLKDLIANPLVAFTLFISALLLLAAFNSINPPHSLKHTGQFILASCCFAALWAANPKINHQLSKKTRDIILIVYIVCLTILCLLTLSIDQQWIALDEHKLNRQAAVYALFFWPLSLYLKTSKHPRAFTVAYILTTFIILIGASETALLMHLGATATFLIFKFGSSNKSVRLLIFTAILLAITLIPITISLLETSFAIELMKPFVGDKSHHFLHWTLAADELVKQLPLGVGPNATQFADIMLPSKRISKDIHHAHNFVLELGLDLGVLGFFILALALTGVIYVFKTTPLTNQPFVAATLISIIILYSTTWSIWQEWRTGFVAFALLIIKRYLSHNTKDESSIAANA